MESWPKTEVTVIAKTVVTPQLIVLRVIVSLIFHLYTLIKKKAFLFFFCALQCPKPSTKNETKSF